MVDDNRLTECEVTIAGSTHTVQVRAGMEETLLEAAKRTQAQLDRLRQAPGSLSLEKALLQLAIMGEVRNLQIEELLGAQKEALERVRAIRGTVDNLLHHS